MLTPLQNTTLTVNSATAKADLLQFRFGLGQGKLLKNVQGSAGHRVGFSWWAIPTGITAAEWKGVNRCVCLAYLQWSGIVWGGPNGSLDKCTTVCSTVDDVLAEMTCILYNTMYVTYVHIYKMYWTTGTATAEVAVETGKGQIVAFEFGFSMGFRFLESD